MTPPLVLLATCAEVPDLDDDAQVLRTAIRQRGIDAEPATWTDPAVAWERADLVVVRTTWDYSLQRDAFLGWAERVAAVTTLANAPTLLTWSTDKHYLLDLADAGLPVVDTEVLEIGDHTDGGHAFVDVEHVVKPTVSAGSKDTYRIDAGDEARSAAAVQAIHATGRAVVVQPYLAGVDEHGETALLYADGTFSHAMRKGPLLAPGHDAAAVDGLFLAEEMTVRDPSPTELETGARVMAEVVRRFDRAPLYARVDLLPSPEGPQVLEVELVEPSLFLEHAPEAAGAFADAVEARLGRA
ncbi:hypothetical protein KLP28_07670 [Nocardioidaceae bacterium]|nr:hypothetical protein KLP28_07670 [Nocardioidaceae bacterium]